MRRVVAIPYPVPGRTEYVTREIHEHRAPTDDSVKLLADFEDKARAKIIGSIIVGDTAVECHVTIWEEPGLRQQKSGIVFSLGGRKHEVLIELNDASEVDLIIDQIVREVSEKIAREILRVPLSNSLRPLMASLRAPR